MNNVTTIPGQTEAETAWVTKRAAVHVRAGWTTHEAIGLALRDMVALYTEMAHQRTPRAKAATSHIIRRVHADVRAGR